MRARGVDVEVLTNSLAATDVLAVHSGYASHRKPLLQAGVVLYELKPGGTRDSSSLFGSSGASLHTKAFSVDGDTGFIGSFNMDPRSVSLNTEMGVLFRDADTAAALERVYRDRTDARHSYRVRLRTARCVGRHGGAAAGGMGRGTGNQRPATRGGDGARLVADRIAALAPVLSSRPAP